MVLRLCDQLQLAAVSKITENEDIFPSIQCSYGKMFHKTVYYINLTANICILGGHCGTYRGWEILTCSVSVPSD